MTFFCLAALFFYGIANAQIKKVFIDDFKIHSGDKQDQYLAPGIHSVLETSLSSLENIKIETNKQNADFYISGSILIIGDSCVTTASLKNREKQITGFSKKSESKTEVLNHIDQFKKICIKKLSDVPEKTVHKQIEPRAEKASEKQDHKKSDILFSSRQLNEEIKGICTFDINNDSIPEIIWTGEKNLYVGNIKQGKLRIKKQYVFNKNLRILSMESFKKAGKEMIIVNTATKNRQKLKAMAFYFTKNLNPVQDKNLPKRYLYKSFYKNDGTKEIIAKKRGMRSNLFYGDIKLLKTDKNFSLIPFHLNKNFKFFPSFLHGNFNDPNSMQWVFLKNGNMSLYNKNFEKIWSSASKYGGLPTYIDIKKKKKKSDKYENRYFLPSRLILFHTNQNKNMIITSQNKDMGKRLLKKTRLFKTGSVKGLVWDQITFDELYKSIEFKGWVSDFTICDINMDGKKDLVVANSEKFGVINQKIKSRIIVLRFER